MHLLSYILYWPLGRPEYYRIEVLAITCPEALQVLRDLQGVAGVLAAHKGQHGQRLSRRSLHSRRLAGHADCLQQAPPFFQQPV